MTLVCINLSAVTHPLSMMRRQRGMISVVRRKLITYKKSNMNTSQMNLNLQIHLLLIRLNKSSNHPKRCQPQVLKWPGIVTTCSVITE